MGNTLMKRGTMIDRESEIFAGPGGSFFKKSPLVAEGKTIWAVAAAVRG